MLNVSYVPERNGTGAHVRHLQSRTAGAAPTPEMVELESGSRNCDR